jgi:hypothetical protein
LSEVQTISLAVTATSVVIGIIYYIFTARTTLQTRQAQLYMQLYNRWTPEMNSTFWSFLSVDFKDAQEHLTKYRADKEYARWCDTLGTFYEGLGVLVREGFLDIRYISLFLGGGTRMHWEKYKPIIGDLRRLLGYSRWLSETEYLYDRLMEFMEKHPELKT